MNKEVRRLVFEFNPTDPKVTRAELEEAVKCLQRAIKHPLETVDGVFECPVPSCNKRYPHEENLRDGSNIYFEII